MQKINLNIQHKWTWCFKWFFIFFWKSKVMCFLVCDKIQKPIQFQWNHEFKSFVGIFLQVLYVFSWPFQGGFESSINFHLEFFRTSFLYSCFLILCVWTRFCILCVYLFCIVMCFAFIYLFLKMFVEHVLKLFPRKFFCGKWIFNSKVEWHFCFNILYFYLLFRVQEAI